MKTLRITLLTTVAALFATLFTGCGGAAGPAGAAGPTGPQGPYGLAGSAYAGTSNPGDWTASSSFMIATYPIPAIDANAVANAVVVVYFESTAGNWAPLAYTYPLGGGVEQTLSFNYIVGYVTLQLQNSDGSLPAAPVAFNFKVVVIPTAVIKQHPGLNTKDYYEVMQVMKSSQAGTL